MQGYGGNLKKGVLKKMKNPEYHVGAGVFGNIYAGTLTAPNKSGLQMWRNRSDVTDEAINAVMEHFRTKLTLENRNTLDAKFNFANGAVLKVNFELVPPGTEGEGEPDA